MRNSGARPLKSRRGVARYARAGSISPMLAEVVRVGRRYQSGDRRLFLKPVSPLATRSSGMPDDEAARRGCSRSRRDFGEARIAESRGTSRADIECQAGRHGRNCGVIVEN